MLTTWTGGLFQSGVWIPGTKRDEALHLKSYPQTFRLPGRVEVRYSNLQNDYHKDPVTYPVQAGWQAEMGRPAFAKFRFLLTQSAAVGDFLRIAAPPYEMSMRLFTLTEYEAEAVVQKPIGNEIEPLVEPGVLTTKLKDPLV